MGRIVVGIDGSEQAEAALRWALDEARLRGASVEAVHVFEPASTLTYGGYPAVAAAPAGVIDETMRTAREQADDMVSELLARARTDDVAVQSVVVEELGAAQALVERSRDADLLVVGSRGRGGFRELLLGSVSHQCANHATCPVVIIRHPVADTSS